MTDSEHRRARWEGVLQTAVFIGALLVLVAVLYASAVVQRNRSDQAQQTAATVARKSGPAGTEVGPIPTIQAYPVPPQRFSSPGEGIRPFPAGLSTPALPDTTRTQAYPTPTEARVVP
jgi:hypothetical protein